MTITIPDSVTHGAASTYGPPWNCRCDVCTDANTLRNAIQRDKRIAAGVPEGVEHGANTYRNYNCPCDKCLQGNRDRLHAQQQAAGKGTNARSPWTAEDIEFAIEKPDGRRYARTALATALELGRSVSAVNRIRTNHG